MFLLQKYTLLALLLGSQLAVNPFLTTDVFEFPKLLMLYVGTGVFTFVNIIDLFRWNTLPRELRNHTLELGFLFLFLLAQILAFTFSTDRTISLMGAPDRFQGLITQIHYVLLTLNTWYFFSSHRKESQTIFRWFPLTLLSICSLSLLPYLFPFTSPFILFTPAFFSDRVYGTFGNPNYLAASIITLLPFLLFPRRTSSLLILPLALLTLFLTGSRSAWIASIVGFLMLGILTFLRDRKLQKLLITSSVLFAILTISFVKSSLFPSTELFERLRLDTPTSTSLQTRLLLWRGGMALALTRPLTGYGQDMIKGNIEPYLPAYLKKNEVFFIDRTHSELIDILVTTGIFGFVGYCGFLGTIFWGTTRTLFQKTSLPHPLLTASLTAFVTLSLFHAVNFSTISSSVLLSILTGFLIQSTREHTVVKSSFLRTRFLRRELG